MRISIIGVALCAILATTPAMARDQDPPGPGIGGALGDYVTGENVGRVLGAGVGGLLGAQVGSGRGQLAAVAIGALAGMWLGGEIGRHLTQTDQQGIARTTHTALETGQDQSWVNPDTGMQTRVSVQETTVERRPIQEANLERRLRETPPLDLVNAFYVADRNSNVRGGPGTDYAVMHTLERGTPIAVVGLVQGKDWYMVSDDGLGSGFVWAPLLRPADRQPEGESALRVAARQSSGRSLAAERTCSVVLQEVSLPGGRTETQEMRACQQPDGTWVMT
jgi:surface antigen